jgi:6,7-dimethyl-8-ribityllumazine synthase
MVAIARFYDDIANQLLSGAVAALDAAGASHDLVELPGALEIPAAIRIAHESGKYDGYVALGCVIRGETSHFDIVAGESARGLMDLAVAHGLAIGNGVLTTENHAQAWERAATDRRNKGADAVRAALDLIALRARLAGGRP